MLRGALVTVLVDHDDFTITDDTDEHNEPSCYGKRKGDAKLLAKLIESDRQRLAPLPFNDLLAELTKAGIHYHRYCAVD